MNGPHARFMSLFPLLSHRQSGKPAQFWYHFGTNIINGFQIWCYCNGLTEWKDKRTKYNKPNGCELVGYICPSLFINDKHYYLSGKEWNSKGTSIPTSNPYNLKPRVFKYVLLQFSMEYFTIWNDHSFVCVRHEAGFIKRNK